MVAKENHWSPRRFREALAAMPSNGMGVAAFRRALTGYLQPVPSPQYIRREWASDTGRGPSTSVQIRAAAKVLRVRIQDLKENLDA